MKNHSGLNSASQTSITFQANCSFIYFTAILEISFSVPPYKKMRKKGFLFDSSTKWIFINVLVVAVVCVWWAWVLGGC
jgi:hypothetical protein